MRLGVDTIDLISSSIKLVATYWVQTIIHITIS